MVIKDYKFVLPPEQKSEEHISKPSKAGRAGGSDKHIANKPDSKQSVQKMMSRVRSLMAKQHGNNAYKEMVSHSERASRAYWMSKDIGISDVAKLRALRMKNLATSQLYAAKGFARHDLPEIWNKFRSSAALVALKDHKLCNE